jgi:hypothetical protein
MDCSGFIRDVEKRLLSGKLRVESGELEGKLIKAGFVWYPRNIAFNSPLSTFHFIIC